MIPFAGAKTDRQLSRGKTTMPTPWRKEGSNEIPLGTLGTSGKGQKIRAANMLGIISGRWPHHLRPPKGKKRWEKPRRRRSGGNVRLSGVVETLNTAVLTRTLSPFIETEALLSCSVRKEKDRVITFSWVKRNIDDIFPRRRYTEGRREESLLNLLGGV